jgi:hypothetical protein
MDEQQGHLSRPLSNLQLLSVGDEIVPAIAMPQNLPIHHNKPTCLQLLALSQKPFPVSLLKFVHDATSFLNAQIRHLLKGRVLSLPNRFSDFCHFALSQLQSQFDGFFGSFVQFAQLLFNFAQNLFNAHVPSPPIGCINSSNAIGQRWRPIQA